MKVLRAFRRGSHTPRTRRGELPLRLALEATVALAFASFLLVHAAKAPPRVGLGAPLVYWGCAGALILLPLLLPAIPGPWQPSSRRFGARRGFGGAVLLLLLTSLPLVTLRAHEATHYLLAVLVLAQSHLLARWRDDSAAAWSLALTPVAILAAMMALPSRWWLLALPLVVLVVTAGALLLHDRHARAEVEARAARVLVARCRERWSGEDPRSGLRARLPGALPVTAALLLLAALLYPLLAAIPGPPGHRARRTPQAEETAGAPGAGASSQRRALEHIFPTELRPGAGLSTLEFEEVMTLRASTADEPEARGEDLGALYLRGVCMDTFTETGLKLGEGREPELHRDDEDGRPNGWTVLDPLPRAPMVRLDVRQQWMAVEGRARCILFSSYPLHAVRAAAIWFDADSMLQLALEEIQPELEYSLLVSFPDHGELDLEGRSTRHRDPRYLQLPAPSAELAWVTARAETLTGDAPTDLARLEAILGHFRADYGYSTRTADVPGLEGIVSFMRRRIGHCTSFAATAVLLLRTQGISSRVATGLLARDFSEETGLYTVTTKNGHAWIEVWFDGVGWVPFDPTPPHPREAALAAAEQGLDEGVSAWLDELGGDLRAWTESGGDRIDLSILLDTLGRAPAALWRSTVREPWRAVVALLGGLVLGGAWLRGRRRRGGAPAPRRKSAEQSLVERLLASLAARGHSRRPGQTLLELGGEVGEGGEELRGLVRSLYAVRFGGAPLEAEVEERVAAWIGRSDGDGASG